MELDEILQIFTTDEKKAKLLSMELANDTGRRILESVFEKPKSVKRISKELDIPLPTVMFHLERFLEIGIVKVVETSLSKKWREIKYYGPAKRAILLIPSQRQETVEYISSAVKSRIISPLSTLVVLISTGALGLLLRGAFYKTVKIPAAVPMDITYGEAVREAEDLGVQKATGILPEIVKVLSIDPIAFVFSGCLATLLVLFIYSKLKS
ncbi:MAG: ArsR/SmtB family transcription factor [Candidatus Methanofastidiosia archaeon]